MTCAVRNAAKHEHSKHFARKVDAQQWLDPATTSVQTGSYVDRRLAEVTVAESAPTWFATKVDLTPTTRRTHDIFVRVHIVPRCGALPLVTSRTAGIAEWIAGLVASGLAAATVRQAHGVFSLILELAVRDGRIARNPADHAPLPRSVPTEHLYLDHRRVVKAAGKHGVVVLFSPTRAYGTTRWPRCGSTGST